MWQCAKCGEQHEETFEICWNCGTAQDGTEDPTFRRADAGQLPATSESAEEASEPSEDVPDERSSEGFSVPRERIGTDQILVTTTPSVEGRQITRYCGLVAGEAVLQANTFRHFLASIADIIRQRSTAYESELRTARGVALTQLEHEALSLGANAVVGVHLDYETVGDEESMLMVSVSGTAVVVE